jgi:hypothetical protein
MKIRFTKQIFLFEENPRNARKISSSIKNQFLGEMEYRKRFINPLVFLFNN